LRLARLARDEAPTALDSLLDANEHFPTENRSERLKLLCSLLSRVREGDEGRLTGRRVRATALIAASGRYPHDVRMAALSALRYVADEQAASRVAAIANTPVLTLNGEALCRAARLYLPEIRARLNKRRETGHLLRPAEPPPESTLLRPIEAAPKGDERLLVRPVEDDPRRDIEVRGDARM